jgi:dihydroorotase-like cyclic amidohydrolase
MIAYSNLDANLNQRLNLAIANCVHIIEPQWNPSVEEQAIARALRMGQTRTVTVIRYSMKKTVEEVRKSRRLPIISSGFCSYN